MLLETVLLSASEFCSSFNVYLEFQAVGSKVLVKCILVLAAGLKCANTFF